MNYTLQRYKYMLVDVLTALLAWMIFYVFRRVSVDAEQIGVYLFVPQYNAKIIFPFIPFFWLAIYGISGYYNKSQLFFKSRFNELSTTFWSVLVGTVILFFGVVINDPIEHYSWFYFSLFVLFTVQFVLTYFTRLSITGKTIHEIRAGKVVNNALILGCGSVAEKFREEQNEHASLLGYALKGFVPFKSKQNIVPLDHQIGKMDDMEDLLEQYQIETIIIAEDNLKAKDLYQVMRWQQYKPLQVKIIPTSYELLTGAVVLDSVWGIPMIDVTSVPLPPFQSNVKRLIDVVTSFIALILLSPFFLVLCMCIGKHPFYQQERIGKGGKPFMIYKFRTMFEDAEADGPQLSSLQDTRITRMGHWLRKYRIDELPQFWNVLIGQMSLVGPRPEREYYIQKIVIKAPYYWMLTKVRPGLTSLGIVKYGYANTVDKMIERAQYDLMYLENISLGFDARIILHTIKTILTGRGM